jgi:hypothetical protein
MLNHRFLARLGACVSFVFLCGSPLLAQEWKAVYDPYQVVTLHLQVSSNDWERVRWDQPSQNESWVPELAEAQMWAAGEPPITVQIRRKGESDTPLPEGDPQKVSLKIDINALVPGQKWRGLAKLSLENGSETPLKEGFAWVAQRLAWEAGIYGYEAAYSGWVKLYVNGELKGVFINVEQKDAQFMKNHGYDKGPSTWLYKVDGSSTLEVGTGNSPTYSHLCYQPFASGPGGGGGGGACAQPNLEVDLPLWINLRGFFGLGAVEAFLENGDGLFTHSGKNSYAVDFDPPFPTTRRYFPWDQDTVIRQGNSSIYGSEPYQQTFLAHPWFGKIYEQLLRDLTDVPFAVTNLHRVINQLEAVLGPAFDEDPYAYGGNSAAAFNELRNWVSTRVPNVRSQLTQPYLPRPVFNQMGGEVVPGFNLTMSAPTGAVYYTLDGTDPRAPGGALSPSAVPYSAPLIIDNTTHVIARAYDGSLWSPMPVTATFNIARYASALRITEIMYHPATQTVPGDEDNYEFLELKNTGPTALNLSGFNFEGITYAFPPGTVISPGGFYLLARNLNAFTNRYPAVTVHGVYTGKLDDGGEKIRLRNSDGNTIVSVEYDDDPPWPLSPDGLGYSLVLAELFGDPDRPETWRASGQRHGSPGTDDPAPPYGLGIVVNEVLAHTDPPFEDAIELFNTGPAPVDVGGWYLSDDFVRTNAAGSYGLKKFRIPSGTIIPSGGFKVFYQRDFDQMNPLVPFALSEHGETTYLCGASNEVLNGYLVGATFGASDRNVAFGRHRTSQGVDFVPLIRPTFGVQMPASVTDFRTGAGGTNAGPRVGPVVINEIMYNPTGGGSEFIELLSITNVSVDLSGWAIAGADYIFPNGTLLPAHSLLLLLRTNTMSAAAFRASNAVPGGVPIHAHDFVLENEGEALRLDKPNPDALMPAIQIERVRYNDKSPWPTEADGEGPSLERFAATEYGNDPINWRTVSAGGSPGRLNLFNAGIAVARNSSWKYHAAGGNLGTPWRDADYADSGWSAGDGVLGYGPHPIQTLIPFGSNATNKPITVYFRKEFVINDPISNIVNLELEALFDDGFVLYLNGTEILRSASMPGDTIQHSTPATNAYNSLSYEPFDLTAHTSLLQPGRNVLCAEVHQVSSSSDDLLWDASLAFDVSTLPVVAAPAITPPGGAFGAPISVSLATSTAEAAIYFTLNGTDPDETSTLYTAPFLVESSTEVRARSYRPGYNESPIAVALFAFPTPGVLEISPTSTASASGVAGGPFSPSSFDCTITNSGGVSLDWSASQLHDWVSLSASSGSLLPGMATSLTISINTNAIALASGSHSNVVGFANLTTGLGNTSWNLTLTVGSAAPAPIYITNARRVGGDFVLSFNTETGRSYTVESTTSLAPPVWSPLQTIPGSGSVINLTNAIVPADKRYFRVRTP